MLIRELCCCINPLQDVRPKSVNLIDSLIAIAIAINNTFINITSIYCKNVFKRKITRISTSIDSCGLFTSYEFFLWDDDKKYD